jgi:hypothetical protein
MSSIAVAQDLKLEPCAPEVTDNRRVLLIHQELKGVWFQMPVAHCILERLALLPKLQTQILLLEKRIEASDELIRIQQGTIGFSSEAQTTAEDALLSAVRAQRRAEEELDHWTNSRWLWAGVGSAATVVVTVLAVWAINAAASK